ISQASMSAWSCCVRTERHMSLRRGGAFRESLASELGGWSRPPPSAPRPPPAPRRSTPLLFLALGELVEAENACERLPILALMVNDLLGRHPQELKVRAVDMRRWPRKNDADSLRARQEALGLDGVVTRIDLEPFARAQEMLTGAAVIPVSVVGPVELELGEYDLREPDGALVETGRARAS